MISDDHGSLQISLSQYLSLNLSSDQKGLRLHHPAGFCTHNLVATNPSVYRDLTTGLEEACSSNLLAPHLQPHATCISKPIRFMDWTVKGAVMNIFMCLHAWEKVYMFKCEAEFISFPLRWPLSHPFPLSQSQRSEGANVPTEKSLLDSLLK